MTHTKPDTSSTNVLVSIVCISYNHERYIAQALDSFLMQAREGFDIEIIIADDASTDATQEIIREYAAREPAIFKPILRENNVGVQKNLFEAMQAATGTYIALCEGDDYWTDAHKLAHQVATMQKHPDVAVCFHPVQVVYESDTHMDNKTEIFPDVADMRDPSLYTLLEKNYIQTNSVLYRRLQTYVEPANAILPLDWYLHILHASQGSIQCVSKDSPMSVYRRHASGVWWKSSGQEILFWEKQAIPHMYLYQEVAKLVSKDEKASQRIRVTTKKTLGDILRVCAKQKGSGLAKRIGQAFPDLVAEYLLDVQESADELYVSLLSANEKMKVLANLETTNKGYSAEIDRLREELDTFHKKLHNPVTLYANLILNRLKH